MLFSLYAKRKDEKNGLLHETAQKQKGVCIIYGGNIYNFRKYYCSPYYLF